MKTAELKNSATPGTPDEFLTPGEMFRLSAVAALADFSEDSIAPITDADMLPATDALDFENPKASLLNHPAVKNSIRLVARAAVMSQLFELQNHNNLWPGKFLGEIHGVMIQCDPRLVRQIEAKRDGFCESFNSQPSRHAELRATAQNLRHNLELSLNRLIKICRKIVGDWLEIIHADSLRALLAEVDRLSSETVAPRLAWETVAPRLAWFGLADFAPIVVTIKGWD